MRIIIAAKTAGVIRTGMNIIMAGGHARQATIWDEMAIAAGRTDVIAPAVVVDPRPVHHCHTARNGQARASPVWSFGRVSVAALRDDGGASSIRTSEVWPPTPWK